MHRTKHFSHFVIIYNPNSTGDAPSIAKKLATYLRKIAAKETILLMPTRYAGHAREIARLVAAEYPSPLIVSVSGDGGYNEVINGVMIAKNSNEAKNPTVTVIGAGNANDHYRVVHKERSLKEMLEYNPKSIDLLKVAVESKPKATETYYAHSYIGVGITPKVAEELNRNKLNPIKEAKIIIKALFAIRPTKISHDGKGKSIDSLVFANISQMAKVLTLTDKNSLHDGRFEVIEMPHTSIFGLLHNLLLAATVGLKGQPTFKKYSFTLLEKHPLQIDGELIQCGKGDKISVSVAKDAIQTLL